jgi:hypothetical protein
MAGSVADRPAHSGHCTSRGILPQELGGTVLISLPLTRWGRCGRLGAWWNFSQPSIIVIVRYVRPCGPTRSDEGSDRLGGWPAVMDESDLSVLGNVPRAVTRMRLISSSSLLASRANLEELRRLAD